MGLLRFGQELQSSLQRGTLSNQFILRHCTFAVPTAVFEPPPPYRVGELGAGVPRMPAKSFNRPSSVQRPSSRLSLPHRRPAFALWPEPF